MKKIGIILLALLLSGCGSNDVSVTFVVEKPVYADAATGQRLSEDAVAIDLSDDLFSPDAYDGTPYVVINDNQPFFTESDLTEEPFEYYSDLDSLGRCGVAYANICHELMPTEKRGDISMIKPTGWHSVQYDCVESKSLYNRCHLIGFQLAGENANEKNLITGTRYMNVEGMLPFENMIDDFVDETDYHVLYRVTPVYEDDHLVASGVLMEAFSVEDEGDGICFNVYCYNVQPEITINYETGESCLTENVHHSEQHHAQMYVINKRNNKIHLSSCESANSMSPANRKEYKGKLADLINQGYEPCSRCHPK